ncbi:MAG: alpha/beta hydrolase [Ktedonobacteraceae bacterium]|nr:alpha/beta hydrolase [Ktedonobacteraceae bacterium]
MLNVQAQKFIFQSYNGFMSIRGLIIRFFQLSTIIILFAGGLLSFATALMGGVISYRSWQRRELKRVQKKGIVVETAVGLVEYQVIGQGSAVLYAHGTPGGFDQGLAFARMLGGEQCMLISPSRPGYLRTPLAAGASPAAQADLYAALLDALNIEQASIIGFSGGGPSALQFALRHPDRCRSLAMIGGIVQRNCCYERHQALPLWKRVPTQIVEQLLVSDPFLYAVLPFASFLPRGAAVAGMLCSGALYHLRKTGHENDLAQFAAIETYPLEQVIAPTLVVHGLSDEDVPFEDACLLEREIPNVRLIAVEGDHSAFYTHAEMVMPLLSKFLVS